MLSSAQKQLLSQKQLLPLARAYLAFWYLSNSKTRRVQWLVKDQFGTLPSTPSLQPSILLRKGSTGFPQGQPVSTLPRSGCGWGGGLPVPVPSNPRSFRLNPNPQGGKHKKGAPGTLRPAEPNCPDSPGSQINSAAGWRQQEANCTLSPLPHLQGGAQRSSEEQSRQARGAGRGLGSPT